MKHRLFAVQNFALIVIYLILGIVVRRLPKFGTDTPAALNAFVLHLALPAVILQRVPELTISSALWVPAVIPWCLLVLSVALLLAFSQVFKWSRETLAALLVVVPLGNTSFLGFPMVEAFFGADALPYAMVYDQFGSFIALATYATILAAYFGNSGQRPTLRSVIWRIITFPPAIALVVALLSRNVERPELIQKGLQGFAQTLVPLIMVSVGASIRLAGAWESRAALGVGLFIKLVVAPAVALLIVRALGLSGVIVDVTIFEAAMPSMVTAGIVAMAAGLAPRLVVALVGYGLVLSFVTLPLWYWIIRG